MAGDGSVSNRTVEFDLEIYTFDIDFAGHVSNISYVRWLEIGRLRLLTEAGLPIDELIRSGVAPILTRTEIRYRTALRLGEPVHLKLDISELRSASATLDSVISSGSRVAATARQTGLFVDAASGKPVRITEGMRSKLLPYLRAPG